MNKFSINTLVGGDDNDRVKILVSKREGDQWRMMKTILICEVGENVDVRVYNQPRTDETAT